MSNPRRINATMEVARAAMIHGSAPTRLLLSLGLTKHHIAAAVAAGALARIRPGVFIDADEWRTGDDSSRLWTAVASAWASRPNGVAITETAARLWGLPTFDRPRGEWTKGRVVVGEGGKARGTSPFSEHPVPRVHFAVEGHGSRSGWLQLHNRAVQNQYRSMLNAVPVTTLTRTAVECAMILRLEQAVAVLDACARLIVGSLDTERDLRHTMLDDIAVARATRAMRTVGDNSDGRHGVGVLRSALRLMNPASESVLESISRVNMVRGGLPVPECGQPVRGADGVLYWCDFLWRSQRVIGEADGMAKYTALDDLRREKARQEALANAGWTVIRWNWAEGVVHPKVMQDRLRAALARNSDTDSRASDGGSEVVRGLRNRP